MNEYTIADIEKGMKASFVREITKEMEDFYLLKINRL